MEDNEAMNKEAFPGVTSTGASDFRLGFALVLLKSKPPAVTLRDYVFDLRRHIRQGRQVGIATYEHRHLDGLQFWKDQYDALKSSEMELKKRVYALEKENELLTERVKNLTLSTENPRKRQKKCDAEGMNRISGSQHTPKSNTFSGPHSALGVVDDFETALGAVTDAVPLIFYIRHLRRLMMSSSSSISALSTTLVCISSSITRVLSSACARVQGRKDLALATNTCGANHATQEMEDIQIGEIFKSIFKIFGYLLKGLDIITSSDESSSQGSVIYSFVKLFTDVMDCLSVRSTVETHTKRGYSAPASKKTKDHGCVNDNPLVFTPRPEEIRMRASHLLINMIVVLDPTRKGHAELYEGFQFILFTRLGQRISFFVFDEELGNPSLDKLREDGLKGKHHLGEQDIDSRQEEAWYLIWLLERVMANLYDSNPTCKLSRRTSDTSRGLDSQSLLGQAKARIRSTLLRGIFGDDVEEFDGLKVPTLLNGSRSESVDNPREESSTRFCSPEFFVQEAWRLVGWQILAGEDLL